MSTLRVDNLQASDGLSPAYATSGIAKVWLRYDQIDVAIDASENVTSATDNAAGDFTVNFTNAFTALEAYSVSGNTSDLATGTALDNLNVSANQQLAASCRFETAFVNSTTNRTNRDNRSGMSYHGDLA